MGRRDSRPGEADRLTYEEDGEEKWMVVDTAGEGEVRGTSTPLSALCPGEWRVIDCQLIMIDCLEANLFKHC